MDPNTQARIQKAREMGVSEEAIQRRIQQRAAEQAPVSQPSNEQPQPEKPGRLFGGAIPAIGGILGGLTGGIIGAPSGPGALATGAGGAAIGTGAGFAVENLLEDLLGRQQETPGQQVGNATLESLGSGVGQLAGGALGKFASPILKPIGNFFGKSLPTGINRLAISEPKKLLESIMKKQFTQEAIEGAGQVVSQEAPRELAEGLTQRGMMGSARSLGREAASELTPDIAGSLESQIQSKAKGLLTRPPLEEILDDAAARATENFPQASATGKIQEIVDDIYQKNGGEGLTWSKLLEVRRNLDKIYGGAASEETSAIATALQRALADSIRTKVPQDLAELIGQEQFHLLLRDAGAKMAARPMLTRGDVIPLAIGGLAGAGTGYGTTGDPLQGLLGGAAGAAGAKALFSPSVTTLLAQLLRRGTPIVGGAASVGGQAASQAGGRSVFDQWTD